MIRIPLQKAGKQPRGPLEPPISGGYRLTGPRTLELH